MSKRAVLLVNLGSPDSPAEPDVRRYLREFLGDERVIDLSAPLRWLLLEGVILRTRPKRSAAAYASIWTSEGSPLVRTSERVREKLARALGLNLPVYLAMRYGRPSIADVVAEIAAGGIEEVLLIPQYPHYAMSSWETVVVRVNEEAAKYPSLSVTCVPPFFDDPDYIEALYDVTAPYLNLAHDHVLFSYHGVPVRHLRKAGCSCGRSARVLECCCAPDSPSYATCYRAQVIATTHALALRAGLKRSEYSISYQSRLGLEPWCEPSTDSELKRLPTEGVKRLLVLCPAFVTDCLETLEEIGVEGCETFLHAGGESFQTVPCLNDQEPYLAFLEGRVRAWMETLVFA